MARVQSIEAALDALHRDVAATHRLPPEPLRCIARASMAVRRIADAIKQTE